MRLVASFCTPTNSHSWLVAARSDLETSEAESAQTRSVSNHLQPEGGGLSAGLGGKVTARVFFLEWHFFLTAYAPGTFPTKNGWASGRRLRETLPTLTHSRPRAHTRSFGVAGTREEGRGVVTPASAGARPSAPAISAGRSAGTRTPPPAAQSAAKGDPFPSPAASLRRLGATRLGDDLPKGRRPEGSGRHPYLSP